MFTLNFKSFQIVRSAIQIALLNTPAYIQFMMYATVASRNSLDRIQQFTTEISSAYILKKNLIY